MTEARQKAQPQKKAKNKSWKAEYVRILLNGPESPDDYPIAAELIERKLAEGTYLPDHRSRSSGRIANLVWRGINMNGRLYAEELQNQIKRASWLGRIFAVVCAATGMAAAWFWQAILDYIKPMLFGG